MSVTFRDARLVTETLTGGDDWSASAFEPYAQERSERMRRLRYSSAGSYLINGFGPDARAKRNRLREKFAVDPMSSPTVTALIGAWVLPEESYSEEAWEALVAV